MVRHTLLWLRAFVSRITGSLTIVYTIEAHLGRGEDLRIVGGASPWGLGAYLMRGTSIVAWYATAIGDFEAVLMKHEIGSHCGQQVWEAMNLLIALRTWKCHWSRVRVKLEVRADNVAALTLVASLRGRGFALNLIARELALDLGDGSFRPDVCSHSPGAASKIADALSLKVQPGARFEVPALLHNVKAVVVPMRIAEFFLSLDTAAMHVAT